MDLVNEFLKSEVHLIVLIQRRLKGYQNKLFQLASIDFILDFSNTRNFLGIFPQSLAQQYGFISFHSLPRSIQNYTTESYFRVLQATLSTLSLNGFCLKADLIGGYTKQLPIQV